MTDLIAQHEQEVRAVCERHGVASLAVFGSAARGELRDDSDVDLLVDFKPEAPPGLDDFFGMREELEAIFGRPVDLATREILRNPYRRRTILRDLRVIYGG